MAQNATWNESCTNTAMADSGPAAPTLPHDLAVDIAKWGDTTFDICRRYGTPLKEVELMMNYFIKTLHTNRYCNPEYTHIKHLVHLLFDSLLKAQTKFPPKHTSAPPSPWAWTTSQSSGDGLGGLHNEHNTGHTTSSPQSCCAAAYTATSAG